MPSTRPCQPSQSPDDAANLRRESNQGRNDLLILQSIPLAERYQESRLSVILDLCSIRHDSSVVTGSRQNNISPLPTPIYILKFQALDGRNGNHWDKGMVFVVNVELMNGENISVPSSVWFYAIDEQIKEGGGGRYFSAQFGLKAPSLFFGVDGELAKFGVGIRDECRVRFTPRNVQSAVQIVDCIANNERNFPRQSPISKSVIEELFPRLSINVQAGSVSVGRGEKSLIDIRDVLIGPFDFERSVAKGMFPDFRHLVPS